MCHLWFARWDRVCARLALTIATLGLAGSFAGAQEGSSESSDGRKLANAGSLLIRLRGGPEGPGPIRGLFAIGPNSDHFRQVGDPGLTDGRLSPGGRYLAAGPPADSPRDKVGVWIYDITGSNPPRRIFNERWQSCWWVNGGKQLLVNAPAEDGLCVVYRIDFDGSNKTKLPITVTGTVKFGSPDGTWLTMLEIKRGPDLHQSRISVIRDDGAETRLLVDEPNGTILHWRVSPDGTKVVYSVATGELDATARTTVWTIGWNGQNKQKVDYPFAQGTIVRPVWSPDSARVALGLTAVGTHGTADQIVVVDPDGKNPLTVKLPLVAAGRAVVLDWK